MALDIEVVGGTTGSLFGGPAGAAIGHIGGSIISGLFGQSSADKSMEFQKKYAKKAHQWEVADLLAAGLNPILSATGKGAAIGGGATATLPDLGASAATALSAKRLSQEIKNLEATERLLNEQTNKTTVEKYLIETSLPKARTKANLWRPVESLSDKMQKGGSAILDSIIKKR